MGKIRTNQTGFSAVEAILVLVLIALVGVIGFMVYKNQNKDSAKTDTSAVTTTNKATSTSTSVDTTPAPKVYTNKTAGLSFEIPKGWSVANEIPSKYNAKMFQRGCAGPILVKDDDTDVLIASEIKPATSDGDFCWSSGDFSQGGNKWVSLDTNKWVGDFVLFTNKEISNSKYRAFFILVNYQTNTLRSESDFKTVVDSAKF